MGGKFLYYLCNFDVHYSQRNIKFKKVLKKNSNHEGYMIKEHVQNDPD